MTIFQKVIVAFLMLSFSYMGWILGTQHMQNQAVDRNFAHYRVYRSLGSPETIFEWNINTNHNTK